MKVVAASLQALYYNQRISVVFGELEISEIEFLIAYFKDIYPIIKAYFDNYKLVLNRRQRFNKDVLTRVLSAYTTSVRRVIGRDDLDVKKKREFEEIVSEYEALTEVRFNIQLSTSAPMV